MILKRLSRRRIGYLAAGLLAGLLIGLLVAQPNALKAGGGGARNLLSWGVALQTDRPFYSTGEIVQLRYGLYNFTAENPLVYRNLFGQVEQAICSMRVVIRDRNGSVVHLSIPTPRECDPEGFFRFASQTVLTKTAPVPLMHLNSELGPDGQALSPGFYNVWAEIRIDGPYRDTGSRPARCTTGPPGPGDCFLGCTYVATVPILVE